MDEGRVGLNEDRACGAVCCEVGAGVERVEFDLIEGWGDVGWEGEEFVDLWE